MAEAEKPKRARRKPKKVTAAYLERAALHYLGRFSSSEANLREVLTRKVRRRNEGFAPPSEEQAGWIADVVAKCVRYGYVDDKSYATQRAELMLRRGKPLRLIRQDLRHKGIEGDLIDRVLVDLNDEAGDAVASADRRAAAAYVRRRRFGAFASADKPEEKREKELAAMARAGFSFDLAREMLAMDMDELTDLLV